MKNGKAAGVSGIVAEMVKASGDTGIELITSLANQIMKDGVIPQDWQSSVIVNCLKGKGDALERGTQLLPKQCIANCHICCCSKLK